MWLSSAASLAHAQREARVGDVVVRARDTACWSSSQAPCDDIWRAELDIDAGASAARVRVVSVEVMPTPASRAADQWQSARDLRLARRGSTPRPGSSDRIELRARERASLVVLFAPVRAFEGRVRITLEIGGARVVVEAAHAVTTEHPDPDL